MRKYYIAVKQVMNLSRLWLMGKLKTQHSVSCIESEGESNIGYYDLEACDLKNRYVAFTTGIDMRQSESVGIEVKINLYDLKTHDVSYLTSTNIWNSQLGSRLIWSNHDANCLYFLYLHQGSIVTKAIDVLTKKEQLIKFEAFAESPRSKELVGLCYARLFAARRGYGYVKDPLYALNESGLTSYDIKSKKSKILLSYSFLLEKINISYNSCSGIRINHIQYSPSGMYLIFLLRYVTGGKNVSKMFLYGLSDESLVLMPFGDHISHACWMNNQEIIVWAAVDNKKLPAFYKYNIFSRSTKKLNIDKDGHPMPISDKTFICDTYNNENRQRELFIYDLENDTKTRIGLFYSSLKYNGSKRCDLHPRMDRGRKRYFIDISMNGKRQVAHGTI